ncbi:MAG: hypothetical protein AB1664_17575 [Thermodesulfobacteriota bacterium]
MTEAKNNAKREARVDINLQKEPDAVLSELVTQVNETNAEIPITLMIGGALVSGMLVGRNVYIDYLASEIGKVCGNEKIVSLIQQNCSAALKEKTAPPTTEESPSSPIRYLHLRGARFLTLHGGSGPTKGIWWRARISEIDGFSLGLMGEPSSERKSFTPPEIVDW